MAVLFATWLVVLLLALYLVFVGGGWQGIYTPAIRQVTVALAGLGLAVWAVVAVLREEWRPRSVLLLAIVACLASLALSTAASRYPRISAEYLGYALLLAALYLLLVRLLAIPFLRLRFGALAVGLCAAISIAFLVLVIHHWLDWWGLVGRIVIPPLRPDFESLTFGNPSAVLTIAVLFLCAAVAHLGVASAGSRIVVTALSVAVALVVTLSGSRAGWLALGVAGVVVAGLWLATSRGRETTRGAAAALRASPRARVGLAVVAGVVAVALLALAPAVIRRATEGGVELRAAYVVAALRMFAEAPVTGTGPGTWVVQRVRYTVAPEADYYIPHAHDIYAQTLSELGLVGALAGLVLVGSLAWLVLRAVRDDDPLRRRWGWAATFGLVYFGAHQVLDFYANMPAILFAAVLPVAWLDATASDPTRRLAGRSLPTRLWGAPAIVGAALVLAAVVGLEASELPAATHARAVDLANAGDWAAADGPARAAAAADPELPPYHLTEGLTADRTGDHARAADAFRQVIAADELPEAWLDLAAEEAALSNAASASNAIRSALRLGYQRPAVAMPAGELALRSGDEALARQAFTAALVAAPNLAGDPWWSSDPGRAAIAASVRQAAIQQGGPAIGWEIALESGDFIGARSLAERLEPAAAKQASQLIDAWTGDPAALQAVLDRCSASPLDAAALEWCARLEGHLGNGAEANRYRAWVNIIQGNAYLAGAELRVRSDAQIGRSDAGSPAVFYGYYTYRRPTPWDLLVPSLLHLTLE